MIAADVKSLSEWEYKKAAPCRRPRGAGHTGKIGSLGKIWILLIFLIFMDVDIFWIFKRVFGLREAFQWIRSQILTHPDLSRPPDHFSGPISDHFWIIFNICVGSRFFKIQLFSKKSIPCGRSGQSLLWKMMPYWISLYEVFTPRCRKHRFLPCLLKVFRKNSLSILSHLRTFSPGFCVYDTIILCSWKIMNWFLENRDLEASGGPLNQEGHLLL